MKGFVICSDNDRNFHQNCSVSSRKYVAAPLNTIFDILPPVAGKEIKAIMPHNQSQRPSSVGQFLGFAVCGTNWPAQEMPEHALHHQMHDWYLSGSPLLPDEKTGRFAVSYRAFRGFH